MITNANDLFQSARISIKEYENAMYKLRDACKDDPQNKSLVADIDIALRQSADLKFTTKTVFECVNK